MGKARASVVLPILNEAASLSMLCEKLTAALDAQDLDWEVIFVDDGSTDETYADLEKLHARDARFKCLRFARNFGAHIAVSAGLQHAAGDLAIVMSADLQEPADKIPDFLAMWRDGYHVIWGIRAKVHNAGLARLGSTLYHRVFAWLAEQGPGQSEIGGGFFLVDARVLDALRRFPERNRNLIGLLLWAGFKQGRLTYEQNAREFGRSRWSLAKKIRLTLDTFVGFSNRPLRLMLVGGMVLIALALIGFVVAVAVVEEAPVSVLIATATGLVVGVQLMTTGLLGEYVWRNLDEARGRPLYVVMDRLGLGAEPPK